ncbi:MAG: type II secretion system protein [Anaerohalosphaera sp.]|nr:type II secretion system protein [Anaerohalosphaera sp.]
MKKAFTLVELMIVVAILGILAAIVLPGVQAHSADAREAAAKDNLRVLRNQIELYKMHHENVQPGYVSGFPADAPSTVKQITFCTSISGAISASKTTSGSYIYGPYIMEMPGNPFNNLSTITIIGDAVAFSATADGTSSGWLYKRDTGEIKCNSTGTDGAGVKHYDY